MTDLIQILAAADPQAATESADLLTEFGIEWKYIVMQAISFSILAGVLWKFAFKPVLATMDERESKIDAGLKYAEEMKVKLAEAEEEKKKILAEASVEAKAIVTEARETAEARISKSAQDAIKVADDITKRAELQIENDRKQMLAEAKSEIARLVVATTAQVLSKELSEDEKSRYSERASASLV
ncbi:F0F1 ATP synthase subunit B [Pelagicoccus sp. SDUM812003]|uniref:F0F1 ATP synthase subunit B n=1 Tax=Pelagicoccus sp. SDUM812003 TaxID=3041267 RepID=UPI00280EF846|nr:F0F1 ATP synthase subunit B [Pelagicoccus sp. SDUM812003]MDQ8204239.1 F0F1 ATP synthase subunit B [Pelagicoccus sp. SDUM812003]